jgi:hypothetical protein
MSIRIAATRIRVQTAAARVLQTWCRHMNGRRVLRDKFAIRRLILDQVRTHVLQRVVC